MKKDLDSLLEMHFHREPDYSRLVGIEQAVLRRVESKASLSLNRLVEDALAAFTLPQFRFAAVGLALCIGLSASFAMPSAESYKMATAEDARISMFAMNSPYLPATRLEMSMAGGSK